MTIDPYKSPSSSDKKLKMQVSKDSDDNQQLTKPRRLLQVASLPYLILLTLLLIVGTVLLAIVLTRKNICRQFQEERIGVSLGLTSKDHPFPWVSCVKTSKSSSCVCPASFIHSPINPSHCIPTHSHCLQSCIHNVHCACHNLVDVQQCHATTRRWLEKELKIGSVESIRHLGLKNLFQSPWLDHSNHQIEHILVNKKAGERLFFSADRRTAITIHEQDDDYLLNERWTKIETNTTEQHIVYTQLDPQTHTCQMSSIQSNGSVTHGSIHTCPGATINAPYYLGVACQNILVLWHGGQKSKVRRDEGWTLSRHHFESNLPRLPILLDPFHRYYSLYDDLLIEIKDLNSDVLGQIFTDIQTPTKFEFIDQFGTILVANRTHMQLINSTNTEAWLDI